MLLDYVKWLIVAFILLSVMAWISIIGEKNKIDAIKRFFVFSFICFVFAYPTCLFLHYILGIELGVLIVLIFILSIIIAVLLHLFERNKLSSMR